MKAVVLLLVAILVVGFINLLQGFGVIGKVPTATVDSSSGGERSYDYAVYTVGEVGGMIKFLVDKEMQEQGKTQYPAALLENPRFTLPRLMNYMSGEGWELVEIKTNGLHIFRRRVGSKLGGEGEPRLVQQAGEGEPDAASEGGEDGTRSPESAADATDSGE